MDLPKFDEGDFLENLLLDKHREAYHHMSDDQKTVVRFAFSRGWLIHEWMVKTQP